ncbi:sigma-70 family RNA polymerase sigma factor [Paraflavitalea sp. CAU 1676]|uniref:RNA polymerase sigma factor n=1 Tax=Paraflavitalea sp. CAU 1676 TaxID=3032598 RepID=UPI0023DAE0E1|nr:sigma-70 family RNA polymerase sigma factor [Paraflavitalea sp. CAU 1676]MDF2188578.1 sigma-70 family RNA polymerase sigma factor [Paraflavitalea sp. CAU 1676]
MSKLLIEKDLMRRFQQGEALAFNSIYNRFFTSLRHFSGRLTCQKQHAEDITVETFAKLYRLCGNFDSVANIKAFLYVTARNACYDHLAYSHRLPALPEGAGDNRRLHLLRGDNELPAVLRIVQESIDQLPGEYGSVLKLAYQQGLKNISIARELSLTESAVRGYRRSAIKLLRIALFEQRQPEAALCCIDLIRLLDARQVLKARQVEEVLSNP